MTSVPWRRLFLALALAGAAVVGVVAFVICWLGAPEWATSMRFMEETRTHGGPITAQGPDDPVRTETVAALAPLHGLWVESRDKLAFAEMPAFGDQVFAVGLAAGAGEAEGEYVLMERGEKGLAPRRTIRFQMPMIAYRDLSKRIDRLTDGWFGDGGGCYDGLSFAFERTRGAHVTSGVGNAACSSHYQTLDLWVRQVLDRYANAPQIHDRI